MMLWKKEGPFLVSIGSYQNTGKPMDFMKANKAPFIQMNRFFTHNSTFFFAGFKVSIASGVVPFGLRNVCLTTKNKVQLPAINLSILPTQRIFPEFVGRVPYLHFDYFGVKRSVKKSQ